MSLVVHSILCWASRIVRTVEGIADQKLCETVLAKARMEVIIVVRSSEVDFVFATIIWADVYKIFLLLISVSVKLQKAEENFSWRLIFTLDIVALQGCKNIDLFDIPDEVSLSI